jgi:drug/metabolite transporter (DMT)-like permease
MSLPNLVMLLTLGAIWGGSFLFLRIAAPEFGAIALTELRVATGALFLAPLVWRPELLGALRGVALRSAMLGLLNTALPFALFAYASIHLPAGLNSILNGSAPLWGAVFAVVFGLEALGAARIVGLALGFIGVAVLAGDPSFGASPLAFAAGMAAAVSYGAAVNYARKFLGGTDPKLVAFASLVASTLWLAPLVPASLPATLPSPGAWLAALLLGALCTGYAYILYFKLIARVGPVKALSVAFIIPVFGVAWGVLFLGESVTLRMLVGGAVVLTGTALTLGYGQALFRRPAADTA